MADALQDGTLTINNLGMYGIDVFARTMNLPDQYAILNVSRIVKKPVACQDQNALQAIMLLSLTFDDRVVDDGPAARLLSRIRE
jgi:pyruvate dehydrogenase E2 component (dihydrolipoamide acetyltransferase)